MTSYIICKDNSIWLRKIGSVRLFPGCSRHRIVPSTNLMRVPRFSTMRRFIAGFPLRSRYTRKLFLVYTVAPSYLPRARRLYARADLGNKICAVRGFQPSSNTHSSNSFKVIPESRLLPKSAANVLSLCFKSPIVRGCLL
jgi:hypothetical protein